jgi:RHS repeat-associated protein
VNGGFSSVSNTPGLKDHFSELQNLIAPKNGYLYIYVSNESPVNVYFDNLQVVHARGSILEETHYYPFGLQMEAISSRALSFGRPINKLKFNGKEEQRQEFSDGTGLEWLDYGARKYDLQIGRWSSVDPLSEKMRRYSPYNFSFNNPLRYIDPDGKKPNDWIEYTDKYGQRHVVWNHYVKDQKGANSWAATMKANGGDYKDVTYLGKSGIVERGFTDKNSTISPYQLNEDGTTTQLEYGKPTTTKEDKANSEPTSDTEAIDKTADVVDLVANTAAIGVKEFAKTSAKTAGALDNVDEVVQVVQGVHTAGNVLTAIDAVGKVSSLADAGVAIKDAWENPTVGNIAEATLKTALSLARVNPVVGLVVAIADITGLTDWLFDW